MRCHDKAEVFYLPTADESPGIPVCYCYRHDASTYRRYGNTQPVLEDEFNLYLINQALEWP